MTVCIAAIAGGREDPTIICCSDSLMSGALGSAQKTLKNRPMANGWGAMVAGEDKEITAVLALIRGNFREFEIAARTDASASKDLDEDKALEMVRKALVTRKNQKANDIVQARYGITYDELRKTGSKEFPPDLFREIMWEVRDCQIGAEFIVYGFTTNMRMPTLIETTAAGKACLRDSFAVIGSGSYLAHSVLMHREHHEQANVNNALYAVYEAKKYAQGDRSVGENTTIVTAKADDGRYMMMVPGLIWLDKQFSQFGPKPIEKETFTPPQDAFSELFSPKNPPVA